MMIRLVRYVWLLLVVTLVVSCSSTRNIKKSIVWDGLNENEYIEKVFSHSDEKKVVTAKMSASLQLNGKKTGKLGGTLRIKKGEVIQISIAPFLGIEVGRAEITPDGLLVIDRMNKRYVEVSFKEWKSLTKVDLNFHILEALFLNEIFLPTKDELTERDLSSFKLSVKQPDVWLDVKKTKSFDYRFRTEAPQGLLMESRIELSGTSYALYWEYDDFEPFVNHVFPTSMFVSFEGGEKPSNASFSLSRLTTNADWQSRTKVSSKYQKVELEELIKMLVK